jgi:HEAT repeat protein
MLMTAIDTPHNAMVVKLPTARPKVDDIALQIANLCNTDIDTVAKAAYELGCIGHEAETAIEPLVRLLASTTVEIRAAAAAAIGRIRRKAEISIPALIVALQDRQAMVRRYAIAGMGLFPRDELIRHNALPVVRNAVNDEDEWVSMASIACRNYILPGHDHW